MKQAITQPLQHAIPPAPKQGDIKACKAYATYQARQSANYHQTLADVWIRFMMWSYLDDGQEVKS